ncbi:BgTH12-03900 [Blumeria graminis f. sp. triticale]|uniref:Bgt-1373 n=4 Tax=Blumeria graminis TaxID=34373 RepID=A0A9X9L9U2_BLUGR|nr:BgTH12-03900 [Blumeria graminis f. sp. triticale]VCU39954.1 Bgt-1373 [Blumeria graminis f. sp. tritici]
MASAQSTTVAAQPQQNLSLNLAEMYKETFQKYKQMKESGLTDRDPELQRVHSQLSNLNQQRIYHQQRATYQAQQQQQQQQQQQSSVNNSSRISNSSANASPVSTHASQPLPICQPSNTNSSSTSSNTNSKGGPQKLHTKTGGFFSAEQLSMLKHQIFAFKCLTKNTGIPLLTQQQLFGSQISELPRSPGTDTNPQKSEETPRVAALASPSEDSEKQHEYDVYKSPFDALSSKINYTSHQNRAERLMIPSLMPSGIDTEKLRADREIIIYNRMQARLRELQSLPANMAHLDLRKEELVAEDTLRRKALIEMKMLGLYQKQKVLRERIGNQLIQYNNLAMTANRSHYRRMKKQSLKEARITEKLEKQQRDARVTREKKKHTDYLQTVLFHSKEVKDSGANQKYKLAKLGRMVQAAHQNIEKEEQKRIERTAKQRLQALKSNDEEAYLALLDQAKDTRITHLLKQTDGFLGQLAASVKEQQRKAAERYGDNMETFAEEESEEDDDEEQDTRKIDYYAVAHRIKEEVTRQPDILVGGTLKEYQLKGLQWMISLYNNNLNGILADEMGLGKTIQTISLLTYLVEKKNQLGPFLVIVPLSTLTNWNMEFEKWAPGLQKVVYKGPPTARKQQQQQLRYGSFQVLLTTYEYIIKDRPILSKIKWIHMIIDEGHRMKNSSSKLSATLTQYYSTRYRLILTGTPLQNNLPELWALLNFVLPNIFKSVKSFDEWFNTPFANTGSQDKMELTEEEQILVIRRLHKVLRPFLLRRLKKDVEKDLPDKTEKVIKCKFSALQSRLYKQMVTHNKLVVSDGKGGKTGARGLSNMIMQLRKLCNHPFVFDEVENQMNPLNTSNDLLWRTSGKFELLDRILPKYQRSGHRVLMFFQMTAIMDIMEDFLRYRGIQFLRLDGTTKSDDRSDLLREFNAPDSPYFMFLLSTRAGGLGLNLQTADTVIIYDSDWNPHQDLQAQDRAHRIGQKNEVRILRLISSNSVEEKILERAKFKLDMDGKVIQAGRFDNKSSETDRDAMLRVMLETAEAAESLEQEEMDDEDLNMILARSDKELVLFQQIDAERAKDPTYGNKPGSKRVPRLMTESELPEIYMSDGNPIPDEPEEVKGRGARERTRVKYDDGLTEEQWLNAVDDDEDSPEAAAARKQARKDRRERNRLRRTGESSGSIENSPAGSRESTEEAEPTPKKSRVRKVVKADKRKADGLDEEPLHKKRKGPVGRVKTAGSTNSHISPKQRNLLQISLRNIYDSLLALESESGDEEDEEEEDEGKRLIIGPFINLPSKKDFFDYYNIIKQPIAMKQIERKIKREEYSSMNDLMRDIQLLCKNAKTYNEDGSMIYVDAVAIEAACASEIRKELNSNPELGDLEGSSRNTPTRTNGTLMSAGSASNPKLKLTINSVQPGGSRTLSDDE